uniref:Maturation n=1 Tax=Leviviridae sp. TaxID=2027243 RepID=A0A514D0J0_9VIRU|nr:MAG: hypothetical protein H1Bulk28FD73_000004 [Leviviridae sp.]
MSIPRAQESRNVQYVEESQGQLSSSGVTFDPPVVKSRFRASRSWTGTTTPNFKNIKKGQLPVNNHHVAIREVGADRYVSYQTDTSTNTGAHPYVWFAAAKTAYTAKYTRPDVTLAHLSTSDGDAVRKLIANAQAGINGNLAQNFAQLNQTVSQIATSATAIRKSLFALKSGNIPGAINALVRMSDNHRFQKKGSPSLKKSLANNWLALQYGWKPLLSDIEGSLQSLGNAKLNAALGSSVIHSVTGSASANQETDTTIGHPNFPQYISGKTVKTVETKTKYGIRYRVANPTLAFLQQTGWTNPLNLAWEILPFSFVADWFLPIGPFLESLTYAQGLDFISGYKVQFSRMRVESVVSMSSPIGTTTQQFTCCANYSEQGILFDRTSISAFPSVTFPVPKMGINNSNGGVARAQNAIALLVQAFHD